MNVSIRSFAQALVSMVLMAKAGAFAIAAILASFIALWLFSFGWWIVSAIGAVVCVHVVLLALKACEHYLKAMPQMSPLQRQQYLNSALLFNPDKLEAERRQRRRLEQQ